MQRMPDFEPPDDAADSAPGAGADADTDADADAVGSEGTDPTVHTAGASDATPTPRVQDAPHAQGAPDSAPAEPAPGRARRMWRRIRIPLAAFVIGVVAATGVGVAADASSAAATRAEVDGIVAAYVELVEAGSMRDALALASLDRLEADTSLVDAGVSPAAPPQVACQEARIDGALATVDCSVTVESRRGAGRLELQLDGAWMLTEGFEVAVRLQPSYVLLQTLDGVAVDPAFADGGRAFWMLPGRYEATIRTPELLPADSVEGFVVSGGAGVVQWRGTPSPQIDADVRASALAFAEACAVAPADGCPALQERPPTERFEVFAVTGDVRLDDPFAVTFLVSIRRPVVDPTEFVVVEVRVDFGEELDAYEVVAGLSAP